jgi:hypothetical protein
MLQSPKKEKKMKKITCLLFIILIGVAVDADAKQKKLRKFYLTVNQFDGNEALTACAGGYHMASMWEILDVTNLRYVTTLGFTRDDSGFGPPAFNQVDLVVTGIGWIRTGSVSFSGGSGQIVTPNCFAYTDDTDSTSGATIGLTPFWGDEPSAIGPWIVIVSTCDKTHNVWCVQD